MVVLAPALTSEQPAAPDHIALRQVFATVTAHSCPQVYNFHMHTNHSDGQLRPDALAQQAIDIGLRGFAITDHHQVSGNCTAKRWLDDWHGAPKNQAKLKPHLWMGVEITSSLLDVEVHILGYAFDPKHAAIIAYLQGQPPRGEAAQAHRVISAIQQAGGIAVLAHPVRYRKSPEELIPAIVACGIDGIETYYAYGNPKPWQPSPDETDRVSQISQRYHLLNTCGTDTHGLNLQQRI